MKPIGDLCGMIEMFVQGVDVLENATAPANDKVVDCDDVLGVLGEGDAADVLENPPPQQSARRNHVRTRLRFPIRKNAT